MAKKTAAAAAPATTAIANVAPTGGALKIIDASNYALINDRASLQSMIYNLQGEQISEFDLDRIKVPAGGATFFSVPTAEGIKPMEAVEGIVLHIGIRRSYWEDPNPSGVPPQCYSIDGLHGIGKPGGDCGACPFNQFGSAVKPDGKQGRGKRCREMRLMLIIRPEDRLPMVVLAPPASIKAVKQWLMKLPVFMFQAVIRLTLQEDKNSDGIKYSKLVPEAIGSISPELAKGLQKYAATLKEVIVGKAPVTSDFIDETTEEPDAVDSFAVNSEALGGEEPPDDESANGAS